VAEGWLLRDRIGAKSSTVAMDDADIRWTMLAMHRRAWRAGLAVIAISLCTLPAGAVATGRIAQNASEAGNGATEPIQAPGAVAGAPAALPANSPEQIRKAQTELRRLDCLKGRIDGKLGDRTRQAVKKFWASAKQPADDDVKITDELIANLAERGDNFCRPPRPFFGFGGRALPPLFAPGARPSPVPSTAAQPVSPDAAH
jgi:peptidoglycan hydrolase-like protein with peptidoglycan-binding domain